MRTRGLRLCYTRAAMSIRSISLNLLWLSFCVFCMGVLLCAPVHAQEPLTNESVIKMVKAGLSEDVVLSMVKTQPAKYTIGPEQLIALKSAAVPDKVVAAMVEKSAGSATAGVTLGSPVHSSGATPVAGNVAAGDPNDPMMPHDSGIYLHTKDRDGNLKMVVLEQAAYQGSKTGGVFVSAVTAGLKKAKVRAVVPGQHAGIRTGNPQPTFYFYFEDKASGLGKSGFGAGSISNPNQFALVKFEIKKSSRETIIMEVGALGMSSGTHEKSMITFKADRIRPGLYKVVPTVAMDEGEYCFLASTVGMGAMGAGASGAAQIFDFAIVPNQ